MTADWLDLAPRQTGLVPFTSVEGKALAPDSVQELADGDLLISGWAVRYGPAFLDRQGEWFGDGALSRGLKAFLDGPALLAYHHKHDFALGRVLEAENVPGEGVHFKARVDGAIRKHPTLGVVYEQIKRGTLRAISVGGYFKRVANKIADMDILEFSITPAPVAKRGTAFEVVAGKALIGRRSAGPPMTAEALRLRLYSLHLEALRLRLALDAAKTGR